MKITRVLNNNAVLVEEKGNQLLLMGLSIGYQKKSGMRVDEGSFTDLISASGGQMSKRYGLVYVDRDDAGNGTFQRIPKGSFYWFRDFLKEQK